MECVGAERLAAAVDIVQMMTQLNMHMDTLSRRYAGKQHGEL